jgi:hypothetical protein
MPFLKSLVHHACSRRKSPLVACVTDVITRSKSHSSEQMADSLPDSVVGGFDDMIHEYLSIPKAEKRPHTLPWCIYLLPMYISMPIIMLSKHGVLAIKLCVSLNAP